MDAQGAHQSWNILVFGDVDNIFGLLVENPKACSVLDLKKLVESKSGIALELQTLFFEEKCLENEKILTDYPNMSTGSALYLARKPLTIETQDCIGVKVTLKIPTKKHTAKKTLGKKQSTAIAKSNASRLKAPKIFRIDSDSDTDQSPVANHVLQSDADKSRADLIKQLHEQQKVIEQLQQQLQQKSNPPSFEVAKFHTLQSSVAMDSPESLPLSNTKVKHRSVIGDDSIPSCHEGTANIMSSIQEELSTHSCLTTMEQLPSLQCKEIVSPGQKAMKIQDRLRLSEGLGASSCYVKVEPAKIELVPGYGILISKRQLDEAVVESNGSPTRLIRNFLIVYFSREELAQSSCYGSRLHNALDKDIVSACIRFVQRKHEVTKSML